MFGGGVHASVALRDAGVAVGASTVSGVVRGVTNSALESGLTPNAFVAATVHEYTAPFVRPTTVHGVTADVSVTVVCPAAAHDVM